MKILFVLVFASFVSVVSAQSNYMALSFGMAMPQGDYSSKADFYNNGYAYNGFVAEYSGVWYKFRYAGLGGSLKFTSNPVAQQAIADNLYNLLPADIPTDPVITYNVSMWNIVSASAGPQVTLPLDKIDIDAYLFAGINFIDPPKMEMLAQVSQNEYYSSSLSLNNAGPGIDAGLNIRYHLNEFVGIKLFAGYQQSIAKGKVNLLHNTDNSKISENYQCKIHIINAGIGLVYFL